MSTDSIEQFNLSQAVEKYMQGNIDKAQTLFLSVLKMNQKNPDALYFMSMIDYQSGRTEVAEHRVKQLLVQMPTDGKALGLLGTILMSQGKLAEANVQYDKGIKHDKENPMLYVNSAICHIGQGNPDKSIEFCKIAIDLDNDHINAYNILGNSYLAKSNYRDAADSFEKALALDANFYDARFNLGKALLELGEIDAAKENFEAVLEVTPNKAHALSGIADVLLLKREYTKASEFYDEAIKFNAEFSPAHVGLGKIFLNLNDIDSAITQFKRALEINPNNIEALMFCGDALRKQDKLEAATAAYKDVLEIDPENAQAKFHLATVDDDTTLDKPENDYIRRLFDDYSETFDEDIAKVNYDVPKKLAEVARQYIAPADNGQLNIIDIGCGTGLSGVEFKEFAHYLKGIDISAGMIKAAMKRGIYNDLEENEILAALVKHQDDTDVIVSADVFVYMGDLESVFLAVTSALKENGLFLFSVESHEGDEDFKLPVTARFTHSRKYIQELAKRRGLELLECNDTEIRTESGSSVTGLLVALKKAK